jgi:hypothetical protein
MVKETYLDISDGYCSMQSKKNLENLAFPLLETFWKNWKKVQENCTLTLP